MNYEQMSDFEINKAVFFSIKHDYEYVITSSPSVSCADMSLHFGDGAKWHKFNPCNNPADAWPVIVENKISVINEGDWFAAKKKEGVDGSWDYYHEITNKNPLRAAMIVFLMMQDNEELKQQKEWISFEESGVPPVGTMLMNQAKEKREVVLVCDDHIVCRTFEGKTGYKAYYFNHWGSYNLSPWKEKTDEEIAVGKMIEFASEHGMAITPHVKKFTGLLYKEIKSGNIKI